MLEIPERLECVTVELPMIHEGVITHVNARSGTKLPLQENGQTVTLALTRHLSADPKGSLLIVSGGPGQTSLNAIFESIDITSHAGEALVRDFDIYGFAPRGVAPSTPHIRCTQDEAVTGEAFVKACIKHTGKEFLQAISTESVVYDIESLRQVLKLDKFAMMGWSYGTKVVARYAELFGENLSAGVLDGVVDSTEDIFSMIAGQEKGYDRSIRAYFADCAMRRGCPFDSSADSADFANKKAQFHRLLLIIDAHKLRDRLGRAITADTTLALFYEQLMWQDSWVFADVLLTELSNKNTQKYNELSYDYGDRLSFYESMYAINCSDAVMAIGRETYIKKMREVDALSDFDNYTPHDDEMYLDVCYHWQDIALGTDSLHKPHAKAGTPKLLFVGQTGDPATPYKNALKMAGYFDGWLLTKRGEGHVVTFSGESECVDQRVLDYLYDPSTNPVADGSVCQ